MSRVLLIIYDKIIILLDLIKLSKEFLFLEVWKVVKNFLDQSLIDYFNQVNMKKLRN